MKKFFAVLGLVMVLVSLTGCKEKRCACTTVRGNGEFTAHSLEPKGTHKDCSELNKEWVSADSTGTILVMECVDEEQ